MATKQAGDPWIDSILSGMDILFQFERQIIACSALHVCSEVGSALKDESEDQCLQANELQNVSLRVCARGI